MGDCFSQMSIKMFWIACCPYYLGVYNTEMSARGELTVIVVNLECTPWSVLAPIAHFHTSLHNLCFVNQQSGAPPFSYNQGGWGKRA